VIVVVDRGDRIKETVEVRLCFDFAEMVCCDCWSWSRDLEGQRESEREPEDYGEGKWN
jgi:hypothetical protein